MQSFMMKVYRTGIAAVLSLAVAGAVAAEDDLSDVSGYLSLDTRKKLEDVEIRDGARVKRWIGPKLSFANYKTILIDDFAFFPEPNPESEAGAQVSAETLEAVRNLMTKTLKAKVGAVLNLADKPGPQVMRMQAAITGVKIETEGMKAYEILPVTAIFGGIKAMTGSRDMEVRVFVEVKFTDSETGEVLGASIRRLEGKNLKGKKDQLHLEDMQENVDQSTDDAVNFLRHVLEEQG